MKNMLSALALAVTIFFTPPAWAAESPPAAIPAAPAVAAPDLVAAGQAAADEFAGFTACDESPERWKLFYHMAWDEVNQLYYDAGALKNFKQFEHKYDSHLCTQEDLDKALKLMTESIGNPWTRYTSRADLIKHSQDLQQGIGPIGFEVGKTANGNGYEIEFLHYGSTAQLAGMQEGDLVKSIDGIDISTMSKAQIKPLLTAASGKKMTVVVNHKGQDKTYDLIFTPTPDAQVEYKMLSHGIGYVRLPDFGSEKKMGAFVAALTELDKQSGGLKALILDLRGDPGGDMPNAIAAASLFLPDNTLVVTNYVRSTDPADVNGMKEKAFTSTPARSLTINRAFVDETLVRKMQQVPLVVMTNGSTASAAEILTGALKDNKRATVIGTATFGKGVGYLTRNLPTGGLISITEMRYSTPSGFDPSGRGIDPNEVVERTPGPIDEQLERSIEILKPSNSAAQFDGPALYKAAFEYIRDNHIKLLEQGPRDAWALEWEHKYESNGTLDSEDGTDQAISTMVESVKAMEGPTERYDMYLSRDKSKKEGEKILSRRVGVGLDVSVKQVIEIVRMPDTVKRVAHRQIVVTRVLEGGPAQSKVKRGDVIVEVGCRSIDITDDTGCQSVADMPTAAVGESIAGEAGTDVIISFSRVVDGGQIEKVRYKLTRQDVIEKVVHYKDLGNSIAYIKVDHFLSQHVEKEMEEALAKAAASKKLILDLRGNRGGFTEAAVRITGMMLAEGTIFVTKTREGDSLTRSEVIAAKNAFYSVTSRRGFNLKQPVPRPDLVLPDSVPIIILTDEETASASEIVTGALTASRRAVTLGTRTFGKGVGQAIYELPFGRTLHVTSFQFFPGGLDVNGIGIEPGLEVKDDVTTAADEQLDAAVALLN